MNAIQTSRGARKVEEVFSSARKEGRRALVGFLTAGDPSPKHTPKLCQALIDGGIDILELGIPFSDPIADGPVIQAADMRALAANTSAKVCLDIARSVKKYSNIPIVFLTYYNPIFKMGIETFLEKASNVADGLVVPDLPEIESKEFQTYKRLATKNGLSTVLLAAPTTSEMKLKVLMKETSGFLYLVSLLGVTGTRKNISEANQDFIKRTCRLSGGSPPTAVGFGISSPEHVRIMLKTGVDGVIVGSAFVNIVKDNLNDLDEASRKLRKFAENLRAATFVRGS